MERNSVSSSDLWDGPRWGEELSGGASNLRALLRVFRKFNFAISLKETRNLCCDGCQATTNKCKNICFF